MGLSFWFLFFYFSQILTMRFHLWIRKLFTKNLQWTLKIFIQDPRGRYCNYKYCWHHIYYSETGSFSCWNWWQWKKKIYSQKNSKRECKLSKKSRKLSKYQWNESKVKILVEKAIMSLERKISTITMKVKK